MFMRQKKGLPFPIQRLKKKDGMGTIAPSWVIYRVGDTGRRRKRRFAVWIPEEMKPYMEGGETDCVFLFRLCA